MNAHLQGLGQQLVTYLSDRWGRPVTLQYIEQIPGGASRETYRVRVRSGADTDDQGLILRRDPATSLIDTERALEFRTYGAVYPTEIPVPEPLLLEEDTTALTRPFSIMREVGGCESAVANLSQPPYLAIRDRIGQRAWEILGRLAALDYVALGVTDFMEVPEHPALRELNYWSKVIEADALYPQPVAQATRRWLEKHLPPPTQRLALVHGDYRSGNFLYTDTGEIKAVLDWEMAHIGDPLEDLAWSLDPLWSWPERTLAGSLLPRRDAIRLWQSASGMPVDDDVFRWWQVFASYKALAIWISSTEDFSNGTSKAPILAVAGWVMTDRQNRILVDRLNPQSPHQYAEPL